MAVEGAGGAVVIPSESDLWLGQAKRLPDELPDNDRAKRVHPAPGLSLSVSGRPRVWPGRARDEEVAGFKSCHPDYVRPSQRQMPQEPAAVGGPVQQRALSSRTLSESTQRLAGGLGTGFRVDLHRHGLIGMTQATHDHPGMHIKINN
jgi:hypothetical protein